MTAPATDARSTLLREGPILSTLLRLSLPNLIALCSAAIVSIAETAYVGALGVAALGGIVFLGEAVTMRLLIASAAILGGIALVIVGKRASKH